MLLFLTSLPPLLCGLFIVVLPTALAMLGPVLVRRFCRYSTLVKNNEVAGFKFATIGVIYAVLLGFAIVSVWEKFSEAELLVLREAGASATLYRLSAGEEPEALATRTALRAYLNSVIEDEWLNMAAGRESRDASASMGALYAATLHLADHRPVAVGVEIMKELGAITEARRGRLYLATGVVPSALWAMLITGALVTVGFTYFFAMENLRAQTAMTGALAMIVFLGLFVIVSYDHPFTGAVSVDSNPFRGLIADMDKVPEQRSWSAPISR
ncbi:DUF4239 domain-containing protein [Methylocystis echinoides]|uniref:Membrane protein n=1 Tax=Methylocystis echinoides TaxID=29468 RepID=A0A9W6GSU2_9HYPH|nr:DUF4239 domain-containing protein [Methylocystis echinoides]GLI92396.1 membrane protein [Methylocystis echinoides]